MSIVLDASAVLAFLGGEPGAERVEASLTGGAVISAVNLAEVVSKLSDRGMPSVEVRQTVAELGIEVESFTEDHALVVGELRAVTAASGLSLGDRACLALALQRGESVLTSDRAWGELHTVSGLRVELVR